MPGHKTPTLVDARESNPPYFYSKKTKYLNSTQQCFLIKVAGMTDRRIRDKSEMSFLSIN